MKNKINKSLIIVDVQNDFCDPNGALYVKGAENIVPAIIDYVKKNKDILKEIRHLYVGSMLTRKHVDAIIKALSEAYKDDKKATLRIVGGGQERI